MGLTSTSTGIKALDSGLIIKKQTPTDLVVALAGNPNVGKSTVFNALTGLNQHTGNWPGKTVSNAQGYCKTKNNSYVLVDIPGTYSLSAHSAEEECARNFICFGDTDAVIVVCDATCLERNLNLVLQTLEITGNVILCVNLLDEAKRKGIKPDFTLLSKKLGIPVVGTVARKKSTLNTLTDTLDSLTTDHLPTNPYKVKYPLPIESAVKSLSEVIDRISEKKLNSRWLSLKLLDSDKSLEKEIAACLGNGFLENPELKAAVKAEKEKLLLLGITKEIYKDMIVTALVKSAEEICSGAITFKKREYNSIDRKLDKLFTSRLTGYPVMLLLLALIFWLTVTASNYPSQVIADFLFLIQDKLTELFIYLGAPDWLHGVIVLGAYRVLAWVVSVMLPPMAIFFPLFTLLEDVGYLPRIAFNLDKPFKKCNACGKQALTMCMGFGCNAAGVTGCRIIDSPRERLLAILTNNFVPCNGRFPTLIAIITMFFIGSSAGLFQSVLSAVILTAVIVIGILTTFGVTKLLSKTLLKGVPSSFTLELPPYRKPQIGKVIVRSIFDRTLFVLGRAASVAAPAGIIIWIMANVTVGNASILAHCANFLDPFASLMGLDGVILLAFILGFPANEIVVPIIIMAYVSGGTIVELGSLSEMRELFVSNGWNITTAISMMLFSLMHWPCSTTLLTVKKETGSIKWMLLSAAIPTAIGIAVCMIFTAIMRLFGF